MANEPKKGPTSVKRVTAPEAPLAAVQPIPMLATGVEKIMDAAAKGPGR